MKVLFDSSVLIPAFVSGHPNNASVAALFRRVRGGAWELHVAAHSLAETYAVMTRAPFTPRIAPATAHAIIQKNLQDARLISLTGEDYWAVIAAVAVLDIPGGAVFDALIVQAARRAAIERIFTFNVDHFRRVWPEGGSKIVCP